MPADEAERRRPCHSALRLGVARRSRRRRRWGYTASPPRCSTSVRAGVLADRDPGADLLQRRLEDRVRRDHRPRARVRGVEGGDDRALRRPAGQQGQRRRGRLVDVQHVEARRRAASAAPGPPTGSRSSAGPPSRCRAPAPPARPGRRTAAAGCRRRPGRAPTPRGRAGSGPRPGRGRGTGRRPGTSQEYGQTMPILTAPSARPPAPRPLGSRSAEPERLQHVPVLRVLGDPRGEGVGERLRHDGRLLGPGACLGHLDRRDGPGPA